MIDLGRWLVAQNFKNPDSEFIHRNFSSVGIRGKIEESNQSSVTAFLHRICVENGEQLLIDHGLWQRLWQEN